MIEGLMFQFQAGELRDHLHGRVEHHMARSEFYAKQAEVFKFEADEAGKADTYVNSSRAHEDFGEKSKRHKATAKRFGLMAEHLVPGETYRLSDHDMARIEYFEHGGF